MGKARTTEFTSCLTRGETVAALIYIPIHIIGMPVFATMLMNMGFIDNLQANLLCYAVASVYMLIFLGRFLRRDFDPLCDNALGCLKEILTCYLLMMAFNIVLNGLILLFTSIGESQLLENPNNEAVLELAESDFGKTSALAVLLAPIAEELMFRAGIFGALRRKSRVAAYILSMLAFSLYHVYGYLTEDMSNLIYLLQYLPVSYLLCRCYERCNTIWGSVFLHMLINFVSVRTLTMLQELL